MKDIPNLQAAIQTAFAMRKQSYAPYSRFSVGAALIAEDGTVYSGCNIENAAYPATICAERTALFKAVSEGARSFRAIVVVGGEQGKEPTGFCPPCGICRQALREFTDPRSFQIVMAYGEDTERIVQIKTLEELLPESFGPENLQEQGEKSF